MKLYEFFNVPKDSNHNPERAGLSKEEKERLENEVFWFIVDNDDLHKEFVLPFVKDLKFKLTDPDFQRTRFSKQWMPMVNKGCKLYYKKHQLRQDPKDLFDEETKKSLCQNLSDKFIEEIQKDDYFVGGHKV